MADALHSAGNPLSSQEIFDFVIAQRPVKRGAINSYLSQGLGFIRVGTDQFALEDWGMASVSTIAQSARKRVFSKAKLCEYIEKVFNDKETETIFVAELANEISKLEQNSSSESIYNNIINSPAVSIIEEIIGNKKRIVAIFNHNYHNKLTKLEILTKDIPVIELIQNTVRELLREYEGSETKLIFLRNTISKRLGCPRSSVYHAVSTMDDVEKVRNDSKEIIVKFKPETDNFKSELENIRNPNLKGEIKRTLSLINIETIDLALFQLGKIFEHTLKQYMLKIQEKGEIPVSQKDLRKLFNMVQWAGNSGLISDKTALHYLRIERNDRVHGAPPGIDERSALLNNASTLVKFYLDYINLLESRREKIA
jgi:hypothetical protein